MPSNPSSEVSIEEIGAEEELAQCEEKDGDDITDGSHDERDQKQNKKEKEDVVEVSNESLAAPAVGVVVNEGPSQLPVAQVDNYEDEDDDSDEEDYDDETILERILGLAEMFPESVRVGACTVASGSLASLKWAYSLSRSASWIMFSSSAILFMPIMIETERMGMEEMQKQQQRQILLGPGAAVSGNAPPMPSM